jgi:RHS repeat-associated protein
LGCLNLHNDYYSNTLTVSSEKVLKKGYTRYELSNHLGNVLAVITDRRIQACAGSDSLSACGWIMYYKAQVVSVSDYYPFGMVVNERQYKDSSFSYRFAFNGMEQDAEVSGKGNSYTTEFRQLDTRLGRWFRVDPKTSVLPFHSPYLVMGGNPIIYVDPKGDIFDKGSQKRVNKHKTDTKSKIASTQSDLNKLQGQINKRKKGASKAQTTKLNSLKDKLTEYNASLTEIAEMEKSSTLFILKAGSSTLGQDGETYYDINKKAVVMEYVDIASLAHELKHGHQFINGEISFNQINGKQGYLHDAQDEIDAYYRQSAYTNVQILTKYTAAGIRHRSSTYKYLLNGPLNTNSTIEQVFRNRPDINGNIAANNAWLNGLTPAQRALTFKGQAKGLGDIVH